MMPRITILGCGWIGLPLARELVKANYLVKGTTTTSDKLSALVENGIEAYLLDLDQHDIPDHLLECDILFINFPPGRETEDPIATYHQRILKVIQACEVAKVKKIIFASSSGVYARNPEQPNLDESADIAPIRASAHALYNAEVTLAKYTEQLTILRFAGLVGGTRNPARFLAGKKDVANPDHAVNLIHLDDCIAILKEVIAQGILGTTLNAVADKHPTRQHYYTSQAIKAGLIPPTFAQSENTSNKIILNTKLKQTLSYSFLYPDPASF